MFKTILLIAFSLFVSSTTALAQLPELNIERPFRRCGTSILLEKLQNEGDTKTRVIDATKEYVPHTGTINIPVILVNFQDVKFTVNNPTKAFDQFFNGTSQEDLGNGNGYNHGSVAQYFSDMSSGTFKINFKIYGPVTLDQKETYYGGTADDGTDENTDQLITDAIAKLQASDEKITDASLFCNGLSSVDCVYILYAGIGQNDRGPNTAVWAKTGQPSATLAGKKVRWYSVAGEKTKYYVDAKGKVAKSGSPLIAGIGTTCHEFSHALGLPDFYPTANSAKVDNQEMEYWDLMDGGEYAGGDGFCPTAYTAFEKEEMGWPVDIQELTENQTVTMSKSTLEGGTAYKIVNPNNSNEYFMLENIYNKTGWNSGQYGNGLLIYHVKRPSENMTIFTRYNNKANYPGMAVVPADGACLSSYLAANKSTYEPSLYGDLFPGTGNMSPDTLNVTELSDAKQQPNFCWYDSNLTQKLPTNKALQNIKYRNGVVTFNYIHDVAAGINDIRINKPADNRIFTVDGVYMGTNLNALPHGVYIINGRKIVK